MLSIPHLIIIFVVALVVFGPEKLPELARNLGKVMAELLLLTSFFVVFVQLGLLGRLVGRNTLSRGFEPGAATYWEEKVQPAGPASYFRQF